MKKTASILVLSLALLIASNTVVAADGLPVAKYLEDPEHKNDIFGFYLNAVFSGITLANNRLKQPLFCMDQTNPEPAFEKIDKRISKLQKDKRLTADLTVDSIMIDILIEEYPCK
jgi:hypothetical protein